MHTVYMVSDATGETMTNVMRACLAQFPGATVVTRRFSFTRTLGQVERLAAELARQPGLVFFSVVDQSIRRALVDRCRELDVPAVSLLDPVLEAMSKAFNEEHLHEPGLQHSLDERYFERIDAMHFALALDDGQATERLKEADVVLVGVSRTSKTPTCMYLANKGIKAANIPLVPGVPPPDALLELKGKLIVGLTTDPRRLTDIRRTRLKIINESEGSDYADPDLVETELREARKLYNRMGWMVIDVTRRSIEEVSATIMQKLGAMNSEGRS
nr:pyruvate, water dikinase regulatory protein [Phaeovibrio sulfidiphilus]